MDLARLMEEGLEDVAGFADRDHARGPGVVHAVVEVVDAARVHDLLAADVRADQLAHPEPELGHRAVVLRPAEQPHVRVRQVRRDRQALAVRAHECTWQYILPCPRINPSRQASKRIKDGSYRL